MSEKDGDLGRPTEDGLPSPIDYPAAEGTAEMVATPEADAADSENLITGPRMLSLMSTSSTPDNEQAPLKNYTGKEPPFTCSPSQGLTFIIVGWVSLAVVITVALIIQIYVGPPQVVPHGAVVSDAALCSDIGTDILKNEGSAVDAAIATVLCQGVVNPQVSGIGGGGFMVVRLRDKSASVIDFRETAPSAATRDMFHNKLSQVNVDGLSVAVPSQLRGLELAHQKYGKLPWSQVISPVVELARNGFAVTEELADALSSIGIDNMSGDFKKVFAPNDRLFTAGQKMTRSDLADTLEQVAENGADVFYTGPIAESVVTAAHNTGGVINVQDLTDYQALLKPTLNTTYKESYILTAPAPSGGPSLLSILNIMEGYNMTGKDATKAVTYQRLVEAFKFGYAQHTTLGDPDKAPNVTGIVNRIVSKAEAKKLRGKIDDSQAYTSPDHYGPFYTLGDDKGASHVSVIGPDLDMVSVTSSLHDLFGSGVITSTGVILNGHMADFSIPGQASQTGAPNPENYIVPGKRPLSWLSPTIVVPASNPCGKHLALGASSGTTTLSGVAQVVLNILAFDEELEISIEGPRLHNQLQPDETRAEAGFSAAILTQLATWKQNVVRDQEALNVVQAAYRVKDAITGQADTREKGSKASVF
ncbi:glutathione hydrolase 1 proenzyme-like [Branchiostoma floridae x Branchiostoma japonicum]